MLATTAAFIDEHAIHGTLARARGDAARVREVLDKAREIQGLDFDEVASLMAAGPDLTDEIFAAARYVKETIYGSRLVLFAPLYISNYCANECTYCAFRARNREVERRALTQDEIAREVTVLVEQGHKRILLVAGESYPAGRGFDYILDSVATIYNTRSGNGEIRRVNVNIAPLTVEQFRRLKDAEIGTYQLFQETYCQEDYERVHIAGRKRDYEWRVTAMHRAMEAGIDDVGIGVLFGLSDWRFDTLAMLQHVRSLEKEFGCGPHTVSVPRIEPAVGSQVSSHPRHAVSDADFLKIVAILRLAVPYTGIIMSTRESPEVRRETFRLGVSQISAGSRTDPGGYALGAGDPNRSQFQLGDHRPLDEVIRDVASMGFMPSFCTACYRLGRTGADFMDLAKPGEIKNHCEPNACSTFQEYLVDYGSKATRETGERLIELRLAGMEPRQRDITSQMVRDVKGGERDVYL